MTLRISGDRSIQNNVFMIDALGTRCTKIHLHGHEMNQRMGGGNLVSRRAHRKLQGARSTMKTAEEKGNAQRKNKREIRVMVDRGNDNGHSIYTLISLILAFPS